MGAPLVCAECGVALTVADADQLVKTDAGPVHRECFDGPVPPPARADDFLDEFEPLAEETLTSEEEAAEDERRRDMGDPPLPPFWRTADNQADGRPDREALERTFREAGEAPLDLSGPKVVVHPDHRERWEQFFAGELGETDCPGCGSEPSMNGGRGLLCRGRSMLP